MNVAVTDGWKVTLAGGQNTWLWCALASLAVILVIVLFRRERRLVPPRVGWLLLSLRVLAILVLVASLFEPVATITRGRALPGVVVVAADLSDSLAIIDPGRPAAERAALSALITDRRESPAGTPGLDVDTMTRRALMGRLLRGKVFERISQTRPIDVMGFAKDVTPASLDSLADQLVEQTPRGETPEFSVTDPAPVLEAVARQLSTTSTSEEDAPPIEAVVLVTDGRFNGGRSLGPLAESLAARKVPVLGVLIGSTNPPKDAAIVNLQAPQSIALGDEALIAVDLKLDGLARTSLSVTLSRPGAEPMRQTITPVSDSERPRLVFRAPMETAGTQAIEITVQTPPGDILPSNNEATARVLVSDDKAKVLLVDGEARWEFRYLRNALSRDRHVELTSLLLKAPSAATSAEGVSLDVTRWPEKPSSPATPDPLDDHDVIILGDVSAEQLPAAEWARLDNFVAQRGGTLVLLSGPRSWPRVADDLPTLRDLLPVSAPRPVDPGSFAPSPTSTPGLPPGGMIRPLASAAADSTAWPMLQLAGEASSSLTAWDELPGQPWVLLGTTKPAATALATLATLNPQAAGGDPAQRSTMAAQPFGLGKVLWLGFEGTWRWRLRRGDALHHRFWGQVVRWGATDPRAGGNRLARFGPEKTQIEENSSFPIQARFAEGLAQVNPGLLAAARIVKLGNGKDGKEGKDEETVSVVPLKPHPSRARVFEAIAPGLPVGRYAIRLDVPALADSLAAASVGELTPAPLVVTTPTTTERIELTASPDALRALAAATGGAVIRDFELERLPELLDFPPRVIASTREIVLWDHPLSLVLFFAILTAEWITRKLNGLA